jgi:hypothetical protein
VRGLVFGLLSVTFAVVSVVDPGEARGQGGAASARDVIEQARQDHAAGRRQEAIDGYTRAYELSGDPNLLFRLGEVSRELGRDVAAQRFYKAYVTRDPRGKNREAADRAMRSIELGQSKPAAPRAVTAPARAAATASAPPSPPRAAPTVQATVLAPPRPAGAPSAAPAAGPMVDLRSETAPLPAEPPGPPLPRWLPWAGLGATLALSAGAVVTGLGASHRYDELRASCGQTVEGCSQSQIDGVRSRALTANLLWAGASVGALATGLMVYVNTREAGLSGVWSF